MHRKYSVFAGLLFISLTFVYGQALTKAGRNYLNKKAADIAVDFTYKNGNWNPVLKRVKNKKIILLGEFNHGSKEIFILRNDLIKALHEKSGFNVVLFESGIGELAAVNLHKETLSASQMTSGLFGGWRTKEFRELMMYIKIRNMAVAGFDVQRTGGAFEQLLETEARKNNIDSVHYSNLEKRFTSVKNKLSNRKTLFDSVQQSTLTLIKDYGNLNKILHYNPPENINNTLALVRKTIANRIRFLRYMLDFIKDKDWNKRWRSRDDAMAANIEWLIDNFYKNEKIIVIAHNFHISKFNEKEEVMGEFLKEKYSSEMYSIGVFAGRGSYFGNYGNEKKLSPPDSTHLDIKHIINSLQKPVSFIHIPKKPKKKRQWLFNKIIVNDTFIDLSGSDKMVLSKHFDGLLFIDKVSPPEK